MADRTVSVDLIGHDKVSGAAKSAESSLRGLGDRLDHLNISTIAIGTAIGGLLQKLGSLAAQGVMSGVQTAAAMEQAQISFATLEKSASKAQGTIKELVDFANATPFDTTQVINYGKQLLGSGLAADHITKTLTSLGDASGALGLTQDETSRVMLAWTQIMNRGAVQAGDLLQITEAGIPIWQVMSRALGKPISALQDMAKKGTLVAKDVLPALEVQMEKDYGGAMAQQAQTLTGLWSTFTSTLNQDMANVLKPFEGYLKTSLTRAINGLGRAMTWLQTVGVPAAIKFAKAVRDNIGLIGRLTASVAGAVIALKGFSTVTGIVSGLIALGPIAGTIVAVVAALGAGLAYLYTASAGFREWINGSAQSGFADLKAVVQDFVDYWTGSLVPAWKSAVTDLLPQISAAWAAVVQNFGQGTPVFDSVRAGFQILGSFIVNILIPSLATLDKALLAGMIPAIKAIGWVLTTITIPALKALLTVFMTVIGAIANSAAKVWGWVPGLGPKLKQAAADFNTFKSDVNAALAGINDRTISITAVYDVRTGTPGSGRDEGGGVRSSITAGSGRDEGSRGGIAVGGRGRGTYGGGTGSSGNVSYLMSYLRGQGFTSQSAAGIIGTLQGESGPGLNPHAMNKGSGAYGIAQWLGSRWNNLVGFAKKRGLSWTDMSTQVAFMMSELGGGAAGVSLSSLKKMSLRDVVSTMVRNFERPGHNAEEIARRIPLAEQVLGGGGTGYEGVAGANPSSGRSSAAARQKRQAAAGWRAAHYVSTGGAFWKNLLKSAASLDSAFTTLSNSVAGSGNRHAAAIVAAGKAQLLGLAKTHDAIIKRLKDAQTALKDLQKSAADLVQQTKAAVLQSASIAAQDQDYSYGAVIDRLQRGVAFATQFAAITARLKGLGLNNDAIQQLAALSPDQGYEQATAILAAGKGGVATINALQAQLGKAGQSLGQTASDSMYGAGLKAAAGLVKGLQAQQKTLERTMEILGRTMARALKKALGIRSPSRVFAEIGGHIGAGLALGIDGSQGVVGRSVNRLVTVPTGGYTPTSRGTAAGTVVNEYHFHGAVADRQQVIRWVQEGQASAQSRGVRTGGVRTA